MQILIELFNSISLDLHDNEVCWSARRFWVGRVGLDPRFSGVILLGLPTLLLPA